jgi:hypothetical protein
MTQIAYRQVGRTVMMRCHRIDNADREVRNTPDEPPASPKTEKLRARLFFEVPPSQQIELFAWHWSGSARLL